jgi:hypothetical protein
LSHHQPLFGNVYASTSRATAICEATTDKIFGRTI